MAHSVDANLMARLAEHRTLGAAPAEEHAWLVAHGTPHTYEVGDIVTRGGERATQLMIMFSGHVVIWADLGSGAQKIFEWKTGDVGGSMPYSRGASPPSDAVAEERTETLLIAESHLQEMIHACPVVTTALVRVMLDRARTFNEAALRNEKLISLGKIAAGLAHELNNPASAVVRSARVLTDALSDAESAARSLAAAGLSETQFAAIDQARSICTAGPPAPLSPVERMDREDQMASWLADHGASDDVAVVLADTPATLDTLDELAREIDGDALDATVRWLAACCVVRSLSNEIETASTRIHDLVSAVKGHTYMDRAPTPEPVDIRRGIKDTLMVLGAKTRAKSATVSTDFPEKLPNVHAVGAELNQVWMNLIDNALDAIGPGGHVDISARCDTDVVVVHVTDDGPGIPKEVLPRVFDAFFTTKPVGAGSGLGLDIVRRLLQRQGGGISVDSEPGRTDFQVRLPAAA